MSQEPDFATRVAKRISDREKQRKFANKGMMSPEDTNKKYKEDKTSGKIVEPPPWPGYKKSSTLKKSVDGLIEKMAKYNPRTKGYTSTGNDAMHHADATGKHFVSEALDEHPRNAFRAAFGHDLKTGKTGRFQGMIRAQDADPAKTKPYTTKKPSALKKSVDGLIEKIEKGPKFSDYDPTRPPRGMRLSPEDRDRIGYEGFPVRKKPAFKNPAKAKAQQSLKKSVDSLIGKMSKDMYDLSWVAEDKKRVGPEAEAANARWEAKYPGSNAEGEAMAAKMKAKQALKKGIELLQNAIQKSVQVSPNDKVTAETKPVQDAGGQSECKQPTDAQAISLEPSKTEKDIGD